MYASALAPCLAPAQSSIEIGGRRFEPTTQGFAKAIAAAHAAHLRPRCLCRAEGVEMYVARLGGGYIVKRMPNTSGLHATGCRSNEPTQVSSGSVHAERTSAKQGPATIATTPKPDAWQPPLLGRKTSTAHDDAVGCMAIDGGNVQLLDLLHGLWAKADLTRWHPGFAGKRSWATVRRRLLVAAENGSTRAALPHARLYIPEAFTAEHRQAMEARRIAQWARAMAAPGGGNQPQLMLLIAELKAFVPAARNSFKAIVRHMPDQPLAVDEQLYRCLGRRFGPELALWGAADDVHMVIIATFGVGAAGIPAIAALSLMPVTRHWLPVADEFERQLVERLVADGRSFVMGLRFSLGPESALATAMLTDCKGSAPRLFVVQRDSDDGGRQFQGCDPSVPAWRWNPSHEAMPSLPPPVRKRPATPNRVRAGLTNGRHQGEPPRPRLSSGSS